MVVRLAILLLLSFYAQPLFAQFDTKETNKNRFRRDYKSAMNYKQFGIDCSQSLINAEKAYYGGRFNEVNGILTDCLAGFDKEQKTEAYRLLSLSFLFSKEFEKADSALFLMLKTNPQYETGPVDPPEFIHELRKYKAGPRFGFTFGGGGYLPFFKVTEVYNLRNASPYTGWNTIESALGYQVGLNASYYLTKKFLLEGGYEFQGFTFKMTSANPLVKTRLEEKERRQQVTLALGYSDRVWGINYKFLAGVGYNSLKKSECDLIKLEKVETPDKIFLDEIIYRAEYFSNMDRRSLHEWRPFIRLRVTALQKNGFSIDLFSRYEFGSYINDYGNDESRYSNLPQVIKFEWIEDDFKANYLTIGMSITKLFYHVKK